MYHVYHLMRQIYQSFSLKVHEKAKVLAWTEYFLLKENMEAQILVGQGRKII